MPITDSRPIWDMTLNEIVSQPAPEGTRASATDVPGVSLEWMTTDVYPSGAWFGSVGNPTQAQLNALPATFLATDTRATVGLTEYSWNGSTWDSAAGNIIPTYNTWDLAVAAAGSTRGWTGYVKRLCGNGYFRVMHNGNCLVVVCGESIIRDAGPSSAGYSLTATGTVYVPLASYTIPAGMIGDGDQFGCTLFGANTGVLSSGSDLFSVRVGANQINAQSQVVFVNRRVTSTGSLVRIGAKAICVSAGPNAVIGSDNYNYPGGLISVDFSATQTITVGATPGAAGNTMKIEQWSFRRIA